MLVAIADAKVGARNPIAEDADIGEGAAIRFMITSHLLDVFPEFWSADIVALEIAAVATVELQDESVLIINFIENVLIGFPEPAASLAATLLAVCDE